MKAFIFNSGTGSRLGDLTKYTPKALVTMHNGESILFRQLRLLKKAGIKEVVISTGKYSNQIEEMCTKDFPTLSFTFIKNHNFNVTNSIYSMYLCKEAFDDDFVIMHGDLVFNDGLIEKLLNHKSLDLAIINTSIPKPPKDFKGRVVEGKLQRIAVDIFDEHDYALQPLYKLSKKTISKWLLEVEKMVTRGEVSVYAENALNVLLPSLNIEVLDYKDDFVEEIDNLEDYERVSKEVRDFDYKYQTIIESTDYMNEIKKYLNKYNLKKPLLMSSRYLLKEEEFNNFIKEINAVTFHGYSSNPKYEEVIEGLKVFQDNICDSVIAIGGGSCIDTAKAIKLYSVLDPNINYLEQEYKYVDLPLIVAPTTAGTGSESTRYSVIYYKDIKQSLTHDSLLPDLAVLNHEFLINLPEYHRKSALLDAFCQAVESYWAVQATEVSREYAAEALTIFLRTYKDYLKHDPKVNKEIMYLANLAGRAINISATTAAHALSYGITTLTGISHGHAVSLFLYDFCKLICKTKDSDVLIIIDNLAKKFNTNKNKLKTILFQCIKNFNLPQPKLDYDKIKVLVKRINIERLNNTPIRINEKKIYRVYLGLRQ